MHSLLYLFQPVCIELEKLIWSYAEWLEEDILDIFYSSSSTYCLGPAWGLAVKNVISDWFIVKLL